MRPVSSPRESHASGPEGSTPGRWAATLRAGGSLGRTACSRETSSSTTSSESKQLVDRGSLRPHLSGALPKTPVRLGFHPRASEDASVSAYPSGRRGSKPAWSFASRFRTEARIPWFDVTPIESASSARIRLLVQFGLAAYDVPDCVSQQLLFDDRLAPRNSNKSQCPASQELELLLWWRQADRQRCSRRGRARAASHRESPRSRRITAIAATSSAPQRDRESRH